MHGYTGNSKKESLAEILAGLDEIRDLLVAHALNIPLVASWHTNLHEYAKRRALPLLRFAPDSLRQIIHYTVEEQ